MSKSQADKVAELPPELRRDFFKGWTEQEFEALEFDWKFWGRPEQSPPDDNSWHIFLALAGRGWGKGIQVSTPIPTPNGWKKMGDLKEGDYVFDENGSPTKILRAFDHYTPDNLYLLTFSDGTTVKADGTHLWTTWTHRDRKSYNRRNDYVSSDETVGIPEDWPTWTKPNRNGITASNPIGPKTRTTEELIATFRHGKRGDLNHSIPVAKSIQYSHKDVIADPYILGYWVGDGSRSTSSVVCHNDELEWLRREFKSRGYECNPARQQGDSNCSVFTTKRLSGELREIGALDTKIIPRRYIENSEEVRRDLLAGLLDSDGYIDPISKTIEFCSKRKDHADVVMELATSLGQKPRLVLGDATLNGKSHGTKYRVEWRSTENFFYMLRKVAGFEPLNGQASRTMHRMITNIEKIPTETVRCIAVDSPNHLFLCGEGMIPTHNSRAGAEWIRKKVNENPGCKILLLGRTAADVRDVMVTAILECSPPGEKPEWKPSQRRLEWPNGSYALATSSESPDQLRGPQAHFGWADELAALKAIEDDSGATAWSNLFTAVRLGENPQIFGTTTPKRTALMKKLVGDAQDPKKRIKIISGSTFDNTHLSELYIEGVVGQYGNSDLAKQELYGEMLLDAEGLFFTQEMIDKSTIKANQVPRLPLRFISVDPSVAEKPRDECGIVAVGITGERDPFQRKAYILEDYSLRASPEVWAQRVVDAAQAQRTKFIVVEGNQGKALLQMIINAIDPTLKIFLVHASQGKFKRAEPVVVAMQQGRVKLVDELPDMTDQMLFFDPEDTSSSPDRMDAAVHGVVAGLITPPDGLRLPRQKVTSASGRRLPNSIGTGRTRAKTSLNRRRKTRY